LSKHEYSTHIRWSGNLGEGTSGYRAYSRNHEIDAPHKSAPIAGSSDPHFRGEAARYNPEDLLIASLSACHMLSYLHLCAINGIVVTAYEDEATGAMRENKDGSGEFTEVVLRPRVTVTAASDRTKALQLHEEAGRLCFIARSVNFAVRHEPIISNS
jgi:organic hydroperoxide reductase OsmC/OhrA